MQEPVIIRTCKHILKNGAFCRAPAVGARAYCHAHLELRARLGKMAKAGRRAPSRLRLPPLVDWEGLQIGAARVRSALAAGQIDSGCAKLMQYALQIAATTVRFTEQEAERWCPESEKDR